MDDPTVGGGTVYAYVMFDSVCLFYSAVMVKLEYAPRP